jgi:superoxide dismutase, Cu-Zn family
MLRFILILSVNLILLGADVYAESVSVPLKGTAADSKISGEVVLEETSDGLKVTAEVSNVPPGKHGFHIHENGSCENGGQAAGNHYNPESVDHGLVSKDGFEKAHAGDLGNLEVGEDEIGTLEITIPGLSITDGKYNVAGKAIVLHEKQDDFGQPTGNAGGRIACGVIAKK